MTPGAEEGFGVARRRMVEELGGRGIVDPRVLEALGAVPRHRFVESALAERAYGDYALPIGDRQTISQPFMVGLMTQALELRGNERVLEIGTGSGYQAAILGCLAGRVYSVERIKALADRARERLGGLRLYNVVVTQFDGTLGWPEQAPFDAILVSAGAPTVPEPLLEQLKPGGRLVIPIGDRATQRLCRVVKGSGARLETMLAECAFVPLIGIRGWRTREASVQPTPS